MLVKSCKVKATLCLHLPLVHMTSCTSYKLLNTKSSSTLGSLLCMKNTDVMQLLGKVSKNANIFQGLCLLFHTIEKTLPACKQCVDAAHTLKSMLKWLPRVIPIISTWVVCCATDSRFDLMGYEYRGPVSNRQNHGLFSPNGAISNPVCIVCWMWCSIIYKSDSGGKVYICRFGQSCTSELCLWALNQTRLWAVCLWTDWLQLCYNCSKWTEPLSYGFANLWV